MMMGYVPAVHEKSGPSLKPPEARITRCPDSACNSVLRVDARTVVIVTCPTCQTTFRFDPERDEKWDIKPPEKDEFFTLREWRCWPSPSSLLSSSYLRPQKIQSDHFQQAGSRR